MDFHRRIQQVFLGDTNAIMRNSELHAFDGDQFYTLRVNEHHATHPNIDVQVRIEYTDFSSPTGTGRVSPAHGANQGPARFTLHYDVDTGTWQASVQVDHRVLPDDIRRAVGHELDEIADIVHQQNAVAGTTSRADMDGIIGEQQQASVFRPGSTAMQLTSHDRAAIRELDLTLQELEYLRNPAHASAVASDPGRVQRAEQRVQALLEDSGLADNPARLDQLLATIRQSGGIPASRLRLLDAHARFRIHQQANPNTTVTAALVEHLLYPQARGLSNFRQMGLNGGHTTTQFRDFVTNSGGTYRINETGNRTITTQSGRSTTVRGWRQEMLNPDTGSYEVSLSPNSTFDDFSVYLEFIDDFANRTLLPAMQSGRQILTVNGIPMLVHHMSDGTSIRVGFFLDPSGQFRTIFVDANNI